jgi:hypothetical protein
MRQGNSGEDCGPIRAFHLLSDSFLSSDDPNDTV